MRPVMAAVRETYGDTLRYTYVDVDPGRPLDSYQVARDFDLRGHPFVAVLAPGGRLVDARYGVVPRDEIEGWLKEAR
ncbi:YbbN family protein [Limnochorda pilosa]|uniref:Thioredoxin n=1 Tax=Limnochorda pilosa TaxID=1555112 RepID=A0A0K2SQD5_LIMPI|nr:thioredoxin family protein [Limnochorda pilosa]BAS29202.1 hypothetical protein LIP_3390 [Limnochorda pilosa]